MLRRLPPVEFDYGVPSTLAKPVSETHRHEPGDRSRQSLDRIGIKVIVMVVRDYCEGRTGNGGNRYAGRVVAFGQERTVPELRVGKKDVVFIMHGKGRMPNPDN